MIPLSVPEISALDGFCDGQGRGIGYSRSWMITDIPIDIQRGEEER